MSIDAGAGWPAGYDLISLDRCDSTMAEASRRAVTGPTWIVAACQTDAVGRRGRAWDGAAGDLAATLVLFPEGGAGQAALRSFVAALALHTALAQWVGASRLGLKWPNDVLLDGRKVAGILLATDGPRLNVGIGVNLAARPAPPAVETGAWPPISLAEAGPVVDPTDLLRVLAGAFAEEEASLASAGFGPTRARWLARATRLGETVTARTTRDSHIGRFQGIDGTGQLQLKTAQGDLAIPAADVYF